MACPTDVSEVEITSSATIPESALRRTDSASNAWYATEEEHQTCSRPRSTYTEYNTTILQVWSGLGSRIFIIRILSYRLIGICGAEHNLPRVCH